jgi:hypothetical protein
MRDLEGAKPLFFITVISSPGVTNGINNQPYTG